MPRVSHVFEDEAVGPNQPLQLPTWHVGFSWNMAQPRPSAQHLPTLGCPCIAAEVTAAERSNVAKGPPSIVST
jgi:hypothetical protein